MAGIVNINVKAATNLAETVTRSGSNSINPRQWAEHFHTEQAVKAELLANMPKFIKSLYKMKNFVGEVPNIIINAVGTGLVAPIFIKHNFLSKTDEDTRTYSAWRQPVSAVLAVITQVGLVAPFNSILSHMTNKGEFIYKPTAFNRTAYQDIDFHKSMIKKEMPHLSKAEVKKQAESRQYAQLENMLESLYERNTIEYKANGKTVRLEADEVKNLLERTIAVMSKKAKGPEEKELAEELLAKVKSSSTPILKKITENLTNEQREKFVYDIVQKHISTLSSNIKGLKQATGLIVSLAILPVTCILLNKVYPKFMDIFFPELSNKKHNKNSDKSQEVLSNAINDALSPRYKVEKEGK